MHVDAPSQPATLLLQMPDILLYHFTDPSVVTGIVDPTALEPGQELATLYGDANITIASNTSSLQVTVDPLTGQQLVLTSQVTQLQGADNGSYAYLISSDPTVAYNGEASVACLGELGGRSRVLVVRRHVSCKRRTVDGSAFTSICQWGLGCLGARRVLSQCLCFHPVAGIGIGIDSVLLPFEVTTANSLRLNATDSPQMPVTSEQD